MKKPISYSMCQGDIEVGVHGNMAYVKGHGKPMEKFRFSSRRRAEEMYAALQAEYIKPATGASLGWEADAEKNIGDGECAGGHCPVR